MLPLAQQWAGQEAGEEAEEELNIKHLKMNWTEYYSIHVNDMCLAAFVKHS
jgi:hypothetical protein